MKIKLDENIPTLLAPVLTALGHEVDTVRDEGLLGEADPVVWEATCRGAAGDRLQRPVSVPAAPESMVGLRTRGVATLPGGEGGRRGVAGSMAAYSSGGGEDRGAGIPAPPSVGLSRQWWAMGWNTPRQVALLCLFRLLGLALPTLCGYIITLYPLTFFVHVG